MVNLNLPFCKTVFMLLLTFSSSGYKTKRGSGLHQQMGSSSLYQGKIPLR